MAALVFHLLAQGSIKQTRVTPFVTSSHSLISASLAPSCVLHKYNTTAQRRHELVSCVLGNPLWALRRCWWIRRTDLMKSAWVTNKWTKGLLLTWPTSWASFPGDVLGLNAWTRTSSVTSAALAKVWTSVERFQGNLRHKKRRRNSSKGGLF